MSKRSKDEQILSAFEGYDEGLRLLLNESERRAEDSRLSPQERKKLAQMRRKEEERKQKEREKAQNRKQNKVTVDLPHDLRNSLETIASEEGVTVSQIITFFLFESLELYKQKQIGFWGYKYPSESPRYEWILVHPKDAERIKKIEPRKNKNSW